MSVARIALVTGAGTGIGRATALALSRAGWTVVLAGRRAAPLQAVAAAITAAGGSALAVPADITDEAAVDALFAQIGAEFGRLDLLFNNAGSSAKPTPIEDLPLERWRSVVELNLTGTFLCTRAAFRMMKAQVPQGGRIINNGSVSADRPRPDQSFYTASKHAVTGLTKAASLEGRRHNIAVGQIDIGNAATDLAAAIKAGIQQADGSIAPEPVMDVAQAADAVVHMASLPLSANVLFMTVMATTMKLIGRG